MLKKIFALSSLILAFAACSNADLENVSNAIAQSQNSSAATIKSETVKDFNIENAILEAYNLQRGVDSVFYYYTKVDLNDDYVPEYFVYAYGPMLSGSGGASALILSNNYKEISRFTLVQTPITISKHKTKNWKDIIMRVSGGGATPSTVVMKFDGETYPSNPSLQQPLGPNDYIDGIKIFTEDMTLTRGLKIE